MSAFNQVIAACQKKVLGDLTKNMIMPNGGTLSVNRCFSVGDNSTAGTYTEYLGYKTDGTPIQTTNSGTNITTVANAASPYTVLPTDDVILSDATAGANTFNLPAASAGKLHYIFFVKNATNSTTITRARSDTITNDSGATNTSVVLSNLYDRLDLYSDGVSKWYSEVSSAARTDAQLFIGAEDFVSMSSGAASVLTELAAGNIAWVQAASVTVKYICNIGRLVARTTGGKGFEITSFDIIYLPITASLTSITPALFQTTYANNVAASIASTGAGIAVTAGTNTLTVPSTGPWVFNQVVTTPAFFNPSGDVHYNAKVTIVTPGTAVPNFYGIQVYFTYTP